MPPSRPESRHRRWNERSLPLGHRAADLAIDLFFLDRLALVVTLLAAAYAQLHFCAAIFEIDRQRNQRDSPFLQLAGKLLNLSLMRKQLAVADRVVIVGGGRLVVRVDMTAVKCQLPALNRAKASLSCALPSLSDFTSLPTSTMPHSTLAEMK